VTSRTGAARSRPRKIPGEPVLLLVTDRRRARRPLAEAVARALEGGVTAVMLREKDLASDALLELGAPIRDACRAAGAAFLVNRDVEVAAALGADGVHLGFDAPAPGEARTLLEASGVPGGGVIGRSVHDEAELRRALTQGVDYVTFGPVWDTPSKRGRISERGTDRLADAVREAHEVPVLALGGVTAARAPSVRRAGAAGIAAIAALLDVDDERDAAAALLRAWNETVP